MGELILMLLLTCVVCGGIPALAFAYINGKIKFSNHGKTPSEKQKRTVFRWLAFLLGSFMGCFLFPTYNFTKTYPNGSHWYSVYLWPTFAFTSESGLHTRLCQQDRTQRLTRRNRGCFGRGWYHYPRSVPHVHEHPRAGYQKGVLCRFWALAEGAPEERREPSEQRCAYACRCPEGVAAPLGCVIFFAFVEIGICTSGAHDFPRVRGMGGITTLGALCVLLKCRTAACQSGSFAIFRGQVVIIDSSGAKCA